MEGGRELFDDIPVDIVVIDEAAQLVEAQTSVLFRESLQCLFYEGKIRDGDNVMSTDYCKPWHNIIPPFSLYDISSGIEESDVMGSKFNRKEEL
eukprot:gene38695-50835_t